MESSKNQNPHSWDEIVAAARRESPPQIDVRASVRAQIEGEVYSRPNRVAQSSGLFDSIMELFAGTTAKAAFALGCFCIAAFAAQSINEVEASELIESEQAESPTARSVFDAQNVDLESDWVAYL